MVHNCWQRKTIQREHDPFYAHTATRSHGPFLVDRSWLPAAYGGDFSALSKKGLQEEA